MDLLLGDPLWFPHPVRGLGKLITVLEPRLRGKQNMFFERLKGALLVFIVVGAGSGCVYGLLQMAQLLGDFWSKALWVFIGYTTLAIKDLYVHARAVQKCLAATNTMLAREKLSGIVGRDTKDLSKEAVVRATIESVAENTTDGIVSPLFYLCLGGPVMAMAYKAVSTLDSMIGHKNEKYIYFGWAAARLDDVMNFIPARITGVLIIAAAFLSGKDAGAAYRIMRRDGKNHSSPNSGIAEAAMAGALGIQLGGPCCYQGKLNEYLYIGNKHRSARPRIISESLQISFLVSLLMLLMGMMGIWVWRNFLTAVIFTA